MDERFTKLDSILENEDLVKEIFTGSTEDFRKKLAAEGIDFTDEEFSEFLDGLKMAVNSDSELSEDALEQIAGGCSKCKNQGYRVGQVVGKILFIGKWLIDALTK